MYDKMIWSTATASSAGKLGKDKGYMENRLRLADAPPEIRELVSLRKDTLSHAYELMKVVDPRKRRKLAGQVARNELSLVKLRERGSRSPRPRWPTVRRTQGIPGQRSMAPDAGRDGRLPNRGKAEPIRATTSPWWWPSKRQFNVAVEDLLDGHPQP